MQFPSILQGQSLRRLLQGAAVGAVTTIVIGFNWGGWTLGGTAKEMAQKSASSAVVAALAPICVDKFQHATDSPALWSSCKRSVRGSKDPSLRKAAGQRSLAAQRPTRQWLGPVVRYLLA